jgi:hypothetical protein
MFAAMLANPDTKNLYAEKVSSADDPAACNKLFQERVTEATTLPTSPALGATAQRQRDAIRRGDTSEMVIAFAEIELLSQFMDDSELQDALDALGGTKTTAAGAGTSNAASSSAASSSSAAAKN